MAGTYIDIPVTGGGGSSFVTSVVDSDSIDLTVTVGALSADLVLSSQAATAGFLKSVSTIKTGVGGGLHVENPFADGSTTGVLTSSDWTTFNNKEPAITGGTTADYWRGDKTFQLLQISALTAVTSGAAAAAGKIGEILSGTQATNTTTGVGASGAYGAATSVSLTAGSWLVWGTAGFNENGAVLTDGLQCGISASATGAGLSEFDTALSAYLISGTSDALIATPAVNVDISSTTTYYLNTKFSYTSGSPRHRGRIQALRIR